MRKDDLRELHLTASLNNLITATFNPAVRAGMVLEDDTEKRYAKLAREAKAWNKVFDILQRRYSVSTIVKQ